MKIIYDLMILVLEWFEAVTRYLSNVLLLMIGSHNFFYVGAARNSSGTVARE